MCFSATASIATSGVLLGIGVVTLSKIRSPTYIFLGSIPILFSIQQFLESIVWDCLTCSKISALLFVLIAQCIWPVWMPLSIFFIEKNRRRLKILLGLSFIGLIISIYHLYYTTSYGVEAKIIGHHITYAFNYPDSYFFEMRWAYIVPTIIPHFVSTNRQIHIFGFLIFFSLIVTHFFFSQSAFSVWCFFAAIISLYIYFIVVRIRE